MTWFMSILLMIGPRDVGIGWIPASNSEGIRTGKEFRDVGVQVPIS